MVRYLFQRKAILCAVIGVFLMGSSVVFNAQDEPVLIGVAVARTSNAALFGQEQVIGIELAEKFFNDLGGINGRPIKIVLEDTSDSEIGAISAFQTLLQQDVIGIVGPTYSQQAFAADPFAEEAGVPVIAPSNLAKGIPQIGTYISRISASAAVVAPFALRAALEMDPTIERVAVFYAQDDTFATSETAIFQETIQSLGLTTIDPVQTFSKTDSEFSTQISNALVNDPQLVVISGLAADGGALVRQLREFGYEGLIVGGNGLSTINIFPICQQYCEGLIVAQAYNYSSDTDINNAFREAYETEQGSKPPQFSAQAFSAIQVFVEALIQVDDEQGLAGSDMATIRTGVNNVILSGREFDTPLGIISFDSDGDIRQESFYVAQVDMNDDGLKGEFVFLTLALSADAEATAEATPAN